MIHEFNDLQVKYGKEVTLINFFKVSIEIVKNNKRILLIPYFMSFDCAQLLTSPNYDDVIKGLDLYKKAVKSHIKNL